MSSNARHSLYREFGRLSTFYTDLSHTPTSLNRLLFGRGLLGTLGASILENKQSDSL